MGRCKKCKNFTVDDDPFGGLFNNRKLDFIAGVCEKTPFDLFSMKVSNTMAIMCGHDGPIYVGEDFGCIHFEGS